MEKNKLNILNKIFSRSNSSCNNIFFFFNVYVFNV